MRNTLDIFLSKYNNPDLYFLHADMWSFKKFKNKYPERCLNFGIGGNRTEHVLWRLQNGELEVLAPKV